MPGRRAPGRCSVAQSYEAFAVVDEIYQHVIHPGDAAVPGTAFELKACSHAPAQTPERQSFDSLLSFLDVQAPGGGAYRAGSRSAGTRATECDSLADGHGGSSPERFAPARANPASLRRAPGSGRRTSAYLTELLVHHPEDLEILDAR
jgi:hypothetical protein